jgi:lysophospholipase L1-like esterase
MRATIVRVGLVLSGIVAALAVTRFIPEWLFWKIGLVFLIVVESLFCVAAALSVLGILVCGVLVCKRFREPAGVGFAGRGLLLSITMVAALALTEAACAVWKKRYQGRSALPLGGLRQTANLAGQVRLSPLPAVDQLPGEFPDSRDDRQIDILVIGESSAEGVPFERWVSIGAMIKWKLQEILPARPISLEILGRSRETLESQLAAVRWVKRRPEIVIIYCGHNEFSSRLPPDRELAYYFDDALPPTWNRLVEKIEALSPFCGIVHENIEKCRIAIPPSEGKRALIDTPAYSSLDYSTLLTDFRRRLDRLVSYAKKLGALPVLIAPPANDSGFEPNRSFLNAATPSREREAFCREFLDAKRREESDPAAAIAAYRALLARQPGFAEAHYRLAQLLERGESWQEAYEHYAAARNQDGYPLRALTSFHDAYREIAARHHCIFIDGPEYFHAIGRHGLLDDFLFQDGLHPSLRGQIALAQRVLDALHARHALGWPNDKPAPVIDPAGCIRHFGIGCSEWREICCWGMLFNDMTYPMRYDPSQRLQKKQDFAAAAARLDSGEAPEALGLPNVGIPDPVPLLATSRPDEMGSPP